jgi:hypothetical protein
MINFFVSSNEDEDYIELLSVIKIDNKHKRLVLIPKIDKFDILTNDSEKLTESSGRFRDRLSLFCQICDLYYFSIPEYIDKTDVLFTLNKDPDKSTVP